MIIKRILCGIGAAIMLGGCASQEEFSSGKSGSRSAELLLQPRLDESAYYKFLSSGTGDNATIAMSAAMRNAISNVCDTFIASLPLNSAISDQLKQRWFETTISDSTNMLTTKHEVVTSWNETNKTTVIRAYVHKEKTLKKFLSMQQVKERLGDPVFAMMIGNDDKRFPFNRQANEAFRVALEKINLTCIPSQKTAFFAQKADRMSTYALAQKLHSETGAGYLITGNAKTINKKKYENNTEVTVQFTVEIIDAAEKTAIAVLSEQGSAAALTHNRAVTNATKQAVTKAFENFDIDKKILNKWKRTLADVSLNFAEEMVAMERTSDHIISGLE